MILVTGATGNVGSALIRELHARQIAFRATRAGQMPFLVTAK